MRCAQIQRKPEATQDPTTEFTFNTHLGSGQEGLLIDLFVPEVLNESLELAVGANAGETQVGGKDHC